MYKINPTKFAGVLVLPAEIAEKHLILSSASQLKVIIYAFSKASCIFDAEEISKGTGIAVEEVKDALSYWKDMGFILYENEDAVFVTSNEEKAVTPAASPSSASVISPSSALSTPAATEKKGSLPNNNPARLNYNEICTRIGESEEIRILLNEAQLKLGRTIGTGDQSSLILLHDYFGLPIEVILCICEYAGTKGKSANMNYIYKIGVDWSSREIDSLEAADEELKSIEKANSLWSAFCQKAGMMNIKPTSSQEKYIAQWVHEWNFSLDMLCCAYEETLTNTAKFSISYMHKVLAAWHKKGIDTPEKAADEKSRFIREKEQTALERAAGKKNKEPELVPDPTASYDIRRAEERARTTVPKLKKRERR